MGLIKSDFYYEIDYMLGTISVYYLLFYIIFQSLIIDISGSFNLLLNSKNGNNLIQSAGNFTGSSETIRQLSVFTYKIINKFIDSSTKNDNFNAWLAGIMDGDGNFDIRNINNKKTLKAIRIKFHIRDVRILNKIQNHLNCGRIKYSHNNTYCLYIISDIINMKNFLHLINGKIRIKVPSFINACNSIGIIYQKANYNIQPNDPYFSGLIDTDGSIIFNYASNRIECNLEIKYNQYSKYLNFDSVIPNYKPSVYLRNKKNNSPGLIFKSIAFKFQTVNGMIFLYDYFMKCRLYSDFKFYRISKIKKFLQIRHYQKYPKDSLEFKIYSQFLLDFIKYQNPLWNKTPFLKFL